MQQLDIVKHKTTVFNDLNKRHIKAIAQDEK